MKTRGSANCSPWQGRCGRQAGYRPIGFLAACDGRRDAWPGPPPPQLSVLLVEDGLADVMMISQALGQSPLTIHLHVAGDGEQALHFLRKTHGFADARRPSLVVLDLNLPRRGSLEVLAEMKAARDLPAIPVTVLISPASRSVITSVEPRLRPRPFGVYLNGR